VDVFLKHGVVTKYCKLISNGDEYQRLHCQRSTWHSLRDKYTSIYWHSCGLKAEQLDKTRKGLKHVNNTINLRNDEKGLVKPTIAVTGWNLVMI